MKLTLLAVLIAFSLSALSHDGPHGPEVKIPPNGGKLIETSNLSFEFIKDESGIRVFAYTHESLMADRKPLPPSEVMIVEKTSKLTNSKKKNVDFKLIPDGDHFKLTYTGTGSFFDLTLVANYKGKDEKPVKWRFEP